jgi:hypothetical protein
MAVIPDGQAKMPRHCIITWKFSDIFTLTQQLDDRERQVREPQRIGRFLLCQELLQSF